VARALLAAAWLAWLARTWRRERDPARAALDVCGAWLVLSPVFHPWYALWIVPWLALRRSAACAWLAVAAPLAFAPVAAWQTQGAWREPAWLWPALALPGAALLAFDRARAQARSRAP
jgi:protein-S-isoprenylcysteine O-methyltransferase Ste14